MSAKTPPNVRVFAVKTRFQELAQRPGGVPRDIAIQQAETGIEVYKAEFVDWAEQELQELSRALRSIAGNQADTARVEEIYARCRQLRDTGTTMGLPLLTFVADNLCRVLEAVKSGAPYDSEVVECHIDALFLAKQHAYRNIRPEQVPEMTSGLHRMLERANRSVPDKTG
jgi:chemotaxis protein histidine kinase CheA